MTDPNDRRPLLRAQGRATSADSKSIKLHPFEVPQGVQTLALRFDYTPRRSVDREKNARLVEAALHRHNERRRVELDAAKLEEQRTKIGAHNLYRELNNLVNVVLIDPNGVWRGRWDRNPASNEGDLVLTRGESSPGFLPGEISCGRWVAAVECHGIFGDEVAYDLEIAARGELSLDEREALASPAKARIQRQRRTGPGWYFGELHSHTIHSDGKHELPELCSRAAERGIDFLCLTDHNTTSGLLDARDLPLTLIPGCELTTFHGHHPIYGLRDIVPWHTDGRVLPLEEIAPMVRGSGGIVSVAHPFKIGDPVCTGCRMRDDLPPESFDMIEVWYRAWDAAETDNLTAYALWNSYWQKGHRITAVAARDWHGPGQESPFPGPAPFTAIFAQDNTPDAILAGMKSGRVIMSGGPILDLRLRARTGEEAFIGGTLIAGGPAKLTVEAARLEGAVELRIFKNGARVLTVADFKDGSHTFDGLADGPGWYRVECWRDGMPRVLSNHVVRA